MGDYGQRISYMAIEEGMRVVTRDGQDAGTVKRVLADMDDDIFDGLILDTPDGDRFVDAAGVADIYEHGVVLALSSEELRHLPEPGTGPLVVEVDPEATVKRSAAEQIGRRIRTAWDRISGKY
jgi:hypothetical protein